MKENGEANGKDKTNTLIFICHHLHKNLKVQYLTIKDPMDLWTKLSERYDHMKIVILPQVQYAWQYLRLQDYKFMAVATLCGVKITEAEMLEKTLSTFYTSNIILQQQYRHRVFKKYLKLILVLLTTEQANKLLLKNHDLRLRFYNCA